MNGEDKAAECELPPRFRFATDSSGKWIEQIILNSDPEIICASGQWLNDDNTRAALSIIALRKLRELDCHEAWRLESVAMMDEAIKTKRGVAELAIIRRIDSAKMKRFRAPIKPTSFVSIVEAAISYSNKHRWENLSTFWRNLRDSIHFGDFDGSLKIYRAFDRPIIRSRFRSRDMDELVSKQLPETEIFNQLGMLWLSQKSGRQWCGQMSMPVPERWQQSETRKVGRPKKTELAVEIFAIREKKGESLLSNEAEAAIVVQNLPKNGRPSVRTVSRLIGKARKNK